MPLSPLAISMATWEIRCRIGEDLGDVLDGEQTELIMSFIRQAIDHQNSSGQRFTGDPA